MILENNTFVEEMLPGSIIRKLSDEEMNEYRWIFFEFASEPEQRLPFSYEYILVTSICINDENLTGFGTVCSQSKTVSIIIWFFTFVDQLKEV